MTKHENRKRVRLTITMAPDLYAMVQELGEGRRGGVSGVIEDCVRNYLDRLPRTPYPLIPERATTAEEVHQIVKELLRPQVIREALEIMKQESEIGEEIISSRSKRRGKAIA